MKSIVVSLILSLIIQTANAAQNPPFIGDDLSGKPCVGSSGVYGPFDYTAKHKHTKELFLVESAHFTTEVESLVRGNTTTLPYGDIAYTLRAWPNHHRALNAISRYNLRLKRQKKTIKIPAECWFQRAISFSPSDATVYMLFGIYLHNSTRYKMAENNYNISLQFDPENIQTHYNFGLLLVDRRRYEEAKKHAQFVYANNYPLPGLKNKLADAGYWP